MHGSPPLAATAATTRWLAALPVYAGLSVYGSVTQRPAVSLLALALLLTLLLWPRLRASTSARSAASLFVAIALFCLWRGWADALLDLLPVLVNAALAGLFAGSLRNGREPLIARFVRLVEGPERIALPAVARYTHGLTAAWTALLALQALLLALLWLVLQVPALGALTGVSPPAAAWLRSYARLGCYLSLAVFMLLEYGWRRWHLRRLPQIGFCDFITRLTRVWPALLHDTARNAP